MTAELVLPDYRRLGLNNLLPSVAARLDGREPVLDIPRARRYVVLLVDGLGWEQLHRFAADVPHLESLHRTRLTCAVPSTTATSLTTLGCGETPGRHGVVGYSFFEPMVGRVINALTWENGPKPVEDFRQVPTSFQRFAADGRPPAAVTLPRFAGSALTRLAFDGTLLYPRPDENDVENTVAALEKALVRHEVVYCYERMLDHIGHGHGVGSWQWFEQLAAVDDLVAAASHLAGEDICLLVTGDHGMINVAPDERVVVEDEPGLGGYRHIGGEVRLRQLYTDEPRRLQRAYRDFLGERATVLTKDEAFEAGWFGPVVTPKSSARIGDVLVAMHGTWALMTTQTPGEFGLVGMHGSLTPEEMYVPLLSIGGRG